MTTKQTKELQAADIQKLLDYLPHRYPFLMIDKVIEINGDESGIGIKNVTVNEPQFMGHFPGTPIMPGVLMLEGMAQTAGILCMCQDETLINNSLVYFLTIDKARFRKPVGPGDTLHYHVKKIKNRGTIWKYHAEALVDGVKVCEAELSAMIQHKNKVK